MIIEVKLDGDHVNFNIEMVVSIDGESMTLKTSASLESHGVRKKASQVNSTAALASLMVNDMARQLHRAVLPQMRDALADALAGVVPPVDDVGEDGGSVAGAAM